jgi:hypothetical protein
VRDSRCRIEGNCMRGLLSLDMFRSEGHGHPGWDPVKIEGPDALSVEHAPVCE